MSTNVVFRVRINGDPKSVEFKSELREEVIALCKDEGFEHAKLHISSQAYDMGGNRFDVVGWAEVEARSADWTDEQQMYRELRHG